MKSILKKLLIILFVIIVNIANVVYASPSDIYNNLLNIKKSPK